MNGLSLTLQSRPSRHRNAALRSALGKASGWFRLAASSQSGGEWTPSIVDILNAGSPMVQTDVDRRAAVGATANGFPTMVFDGSDVHLAPQSPAHSSTTKVGIWIWFKPASVTGTQGLYYVINGQAGATTSRLGLLAVGSVLRIFAWINNTDGRFFNSASGAFVIGAWDAIYLQYDSSRGGDANVACYLNGAALSLSGFNVGAGGPLGALQAATGSAMVGAVVDTAVSGAIVNGGQMIPPMFFNDNLTAAEIAAMMTLEMPT